MTFLVLTNLALSLAAFVLIILTIVAVAHHREWSYGKRWLWGILSFILGLLGSGIAATLMRKKKLAIVNFVVLIGNIVVTIYLYYFAGVRGAPNSL